MAGLRRPLEHLDRAQQATEGVLAAQFRHQCDDLRRAPFYAAGVIDDLAGKLSRPGR